MNNIVRIARKELASFFSSPAAFIFVGVFLTVLLFVFFWFERFFARNIADIRPLFDWMPILLIFLISAMTMRMWSEERRSGTLEFLLTSPVTPFQLVLGKFFACLMLVGIALVLTLPLPITVSMVGPLDWGPVFGGYLASLALAAAYISIGLFVSSRTDNQVVSLIIAVLVCGAFYLLGSDVLTGLLGNAGSEFLRLLGSGSRFESISRGVIDLRDIYYYLSIVGVFLVLNIYSLESLRWSDEGRDKKHWQWRSAAALVVVNLIAVNLWLGQLGWARADLTSGSIYSISSATRNYLNQLREPLLIRAYFSSATHPQLAPLVPRLRDLLREYEIAGDGRVRVEIVDPLEDPKLEVEANQQYGIRPVPFQTASKYQSSVTNSYFDILVKYGDGFTTLNYSNMIEIKRQQGRELSVDLRDPEFEITRAIKKVLNSYRGGGNILNAIPGKVELTAYVSPESKLPEPLPALRTQLEALFKDYKESAPDKFAGTFADPDAGGGVAARQLQEQYGLQPLAVGLLTPKKFWFHLLLKNGDVVEQVPLPETLDKDGLKRNIDAALKRFAPGALRTVALHTPEPNPMAQFGQGDATQSFRQLEDKLRENAVVLGAPLTDGKVPDAADILVVAAPDKLDDKQIFGIDQFLMKGGTVVLSTAPFKASFRNNLEITRSPTGLEKWLAFNGFKLGESLVLDPQNTPIPVPIERNVGGYQVQQIQLLDYPPFADIRGDGLAQKDAPTVGLSQLTVSWPAPIVVDEAKLDGRQVVKLIETSPNSWDSGSMDGVPDYETYPAAGFPKGEKIGSQLVGAMMTGTFNSYFAGKPSPLAKDAEPAETKPDAENPHAADAPDKAAGEDARGKPTFTSVIERSPESARIILVSSGTFVSDDLLQLAGSVNQTVYDTPLAFVQNAVEWSLEDRGLLELRSRGGQFSRTLEPMEAGSQAFWEYFNYVLALIGLAIVYVIHRALRSHATRRYETILGINGA
jgi:ABC-2 type transport system permease protein